MDPNVKLALDALGEITDNHSEAIIVAAKALTRVGAALQAGIEERMALGAALKGNNTSIMLIKTSLGLNNEKLQECLERLANLDQRITALEGGNLLRMQT